MLRLLIYALLLCLTTTAAIAQDNWPYQWSPPLQLSPEDGILRFSPKSLTRKADDPDQGSFLTGICQATYLGCDSNPFVGLFGNSRLRGQGKFKFHAGIDILATRGAPVLAIAAGTVVVYNLNYFGSQTVGLRTQLCGMDMEVIYAHLDSAYVSTGAQVSAGQPLGETGRNGTQFSGIGIPTHLHLEFRPTERGANFAAALGKLNSECGIKQIRVGAGHGLIKIDPWPFLAPLYNAYAQQMANAGQDLANFNLTDAQVLQAYYADTKFPFDEISYVGPVFDKPYALSGMPAPTLATFATPLLIDLTQ